MHMNSRRQDSRYLCAELARVNWVIGQQHFETTEAVLEDIAAQGGCVQLEEPIDVGTAVVLTFGDERFNGRVRYCVAGEFGYFVGIKFAQENPWSQDLALPAHLTNLATVRSETPPIG
jgi:hypothetical protein